MGKIECLPVTVNSTIIGNKLAELFTGQFPTDPEELLPAADGTCNLRKRIVKTLGMKDWPIFSLGNKSEICF